MTKLGGINTCDGILGQVVTANWAVHCSDPWGTKARAIVCAVNVSGWRLGTRCSSSRFTGSLMACEVTASLLANTGVTVPTSQLWSWGMKMASHQNGRIMLSAAQFWVSLQSPLGSCSSRRLCQEAQSQLIRPQLIMGWISYQFPTTCWVYLFGPRHICLFQFGIALKLHLAAELENKEAGWVGVCGIYKHHKLMNICQLGGCSASRQ